MVKTSDVKIVYTSYIASYFHYTVCSYRAQLYILTRLVKVPESEQLQDTSKESIFLAALLERCQETLTAILPSSELLIMQLISVGVSV